MHMLSFLCGVAAVLIVETVCLAIASAVLLIKTRKKKRGGCR